MGGHPSVLLVDDTPGEVANFAAAFDDVTQVRAVYELQSALNGPRRFDVAFVDFNIGSASHTGLSALVQLRRQRPSIRVVAYSQLAESGRTLYACAARHWFGAD